MVKISTKQKGDEAETKACEFLIQQKFILLAKNYRCHFGEIDLIMQDKEDIVFVEVRSRQRTDYGNAIESVDYYKREKLIKTATHFLQSKRWLYQFNSRFDIIAFHPVLGKMQLEWIKNAFPRY